MRRLGARRRGSALLISTIFLFTVGVPAIFAMWVLAQGITLQTRAALVAESSAYAANTQARPGSTAGTIAFVAAGKTPQVEAERVLALNIQRGGYGMTPDNTRIYVYEHPVNVSPQTSLEIDPNCTGVATAPGSTASNTCWCSARSVSEGPFDQRPTLSGTNDCASEPHRQHRASGIETVVRHRFKPCGTIARFPVCGERTITQMGRSDWAFYDPQGTPPQKAPQWIEGDEPVITGSRELGQTVQTTNGTWVGTQPITYRYQWQREGADGEWVTIEGQAERTYTTTGGDRDRTIRACVSATNDVGSAGPVCSAAFGPIIPGLTVTGGTLTEDATHYYRTFTASGTLTITGGTLTADALVVAGGGAGGSMNADFVLTGVAGGGGGGGVVSAQGLVLPSGATPVSVGAGGLPATGRGRNGGNSSISSVVAIGGGGGAGWDGEQTGDGRNGGSGGGGRSLSPAGSGVAGQGTDGYAPRFLGYGGGGGGAGRAADSQLSGGDGIRIAIWGSSFWAGGGGGGAINTDGASGGSGGGGRGGLRGMSGSDGSPNTGGGGGGANATYSVGYLAGGSGGSGIVVIRYPKSAVGG